MKKLKKRFEDWFLGLSIWKRLVVVACIMLVFTGITIVIDNNSKEVSDQVKQEQVKKSKEEKEKEQTKEVKKEHKAESATEESEPVEETQEVKEEPTTEETFDIDDEETEANDTSDEYFTEKEYYENIEGYFLSVSDAGESLYQFGDELTSGEITPEAKEYIQQASDELEIGSYIISEEGMYLKVPESLQPFHNKVLEMDGLYQQGISELKQGSDTEDIETLESGMDKLEQANALLLEINSEMED